MVRSDGKHGGEHELVVFLHEPGNAAQRDPVEQCGRIVGCAGVGVGWLHLPSDPHEVILQWAAIRREAADGTGGR